ncbi:biotin-dependent carboxyltransferase [Arsenicitalea aurantiaca]|uniref:Biotin-dependent carboxyltransferase n=1 Tax=Arsenicitalea aurantiaca TaxID=1783274 RepID=A0A433XFN1_9HYPH|nr:biotin-dependent carboxyltransferase family protein [Arsenicitalea aurantiaca]RUT32866.1 biotin-dependent carboxyltransferase [Arsenicitalea aurantiaca]
MSAALEITRAGPLVSIQDAGRFSALRHGVAASGPMDRAAFAAAGAALPARGTAGLEFTAAGLAFTLAGGPTLIGFAGGAFAITRNGSPLPWPGHARLAPGDRIAIAPGPSGNYGYLRLDREILVPPLMGSRATNLTIGLGGFAGRALAPGDSVPLGPACAPEPAKPVPPAPADGPIRILWGLHADRFPAALRTRFLEADFTVSRRLDRMGVRLDDGEGVFAGAAILSLVSDAIVPGDIQILGDGTPIVLMADHQPTGGYPRIATIISADRDRFAQLRPGTPVRFRSVTLDRARP